MLKQTGCFADSDNIVCYFFKCVYCFRNLFEGKKPTYFIILFLKMSFSLFFFFPLAILSPFYMFVCVCGFCFVFDVVYFLIYMFIDFLSGSLMVKRAYRCIHLYYVPVVNSCLMC